MINKLVYSNKDHDELVTNTIIVAEQFHKQHRNVMQTARKIAAENSAAEKMFIESFYIDGNNHKQPMIVMNRDGFSLLAMGFTGKKAMQFKLDFINQFNEMEQQVKSQRIELPTTPQAMTKALLENMNANNEDIKSIKSDVKDLKDNQVIQPAEYSNINLLVSRAVYNYINLRSLSLTKKQIGLLFKDIGHGIKQISGVRTRTQIRAKDAERVYQYIDAWTPSTATMIEIKDMGTEQQDLKV